MATTRTSTCKRPLRSSAAADASGNKNEMRIKQRDPPPNIDSRYTFEEALCEKVGISLEEFLSSKFR